MAVMNIPIWDLRTLIHIPRVHILVIFLTIHLSSKCKKPSWINTWIRSIFIVPAAVVADVSLTTQVTHTMQWALAIVVVAPPHHLLQKVLVIADVERIVPEILGRSVVTGEIEDGVLIQLVVVALQLSPQPLPLDVIIITHHHHIPWMIILVIMVITPPSSKCGNHRIK